MKNKVWLLKVPIVALFATAFYISILGERGELENRFLFNQVYPALRTISGTMTNWKFKLRGPQPPEKKVVIVEVDSASLEQLGRWPWSRDLTAILIDNIFQSGAKVVGLDMVFSEKDVRIPEEIATVMRERNMGDLVELAETDRQLEQVIAKYRDRLVLGWTSENTCRPAYRNKEQCPVTHPDAMATHPEHMPKFAYSHFEIPETFDPQKTPVLSLVTFIANIPMFAQQAFHSGSFNAWPDRDGYIRDTSLLIMANGVPYPTLPLEMARVGMNEELDIQFNEDHKIQKIQFKKSGVEIPSSPLGHVAYNFKGPSYSFPYVSALEIMLGEETLHTGWDRKLASNRYDLFKDAYVLIGVSALGVHDMRAFPFDSNTPGVEGHATLLDNILSGQYMRTTANVDESIWIFMFMIVGALIFSYYTQKLEAIPALTAFMAVILGFGFFDFKVLFENNVNWNTAFFYLEISAIFVMTIVVKYVLEERNKKFIKGAFSKYVAPAIVDSILKDPSKLTVGGEKRELSILFSDIRSFTTFSERMDAKELATFLNDYLGIMTNLIFDNEGTLDKYIGDAVMAFWGAPLDQDEHAYNATLTAQKMMRALDENRQRLLDQYGVEVNIGIGINSGHVNVGNMGSSEIFEYTVIGDHVNLASRLEGLTKYYGVSILVTRFTFDCIERAGKPLPQHRVLDHVKVKGKKNAVELIEVCYREGISQRGLDLFQEAREHYSNREWDQAIEKFQQANDLLQVDQDTPDGCCQMFVDRCQKFKENPPEADWDGSWKMTEK